MEFVHQVGRRGGRVLALTVTWEARAGTAGGHRRGQGQGMTGAPGSNAKQPRESRIDPNSFNVRVTCLHLAGAAPCVAPYADAQTAQRGATSLKRASSNTKNVVRMGGSARQASAMARHRCRCTTRCASSRVRCRPILTS